MSQATISMDDQGVIQISGILDHNNGGPLREQGQRLIQNSRASKVQINCAGVTKSSSVGLALLLAFMRDCQSEGKAVELIQLPEDMRKIAQVCGLSDILGIEPGRFE
ncbi:STAS domain-containing protein [Denitrificimonas sp. JX-1]|uniref:STAS domain-containing protein n=1 Tax=Denitrificimonas halotolerans TaxID=3098930 RepID=A0ABU5GTV1_9GAMM|nr:STAS domain-containing protein [Denitrificimonas sp. JX-1]MDY7220418.1 STAS domain-containing protein [Denitrificimonas sp. JX-1]